MVIMKFVIALVFVAPLFAQTCTVDPLTFNISAAQTTGTIHVSAGCGSYTATIPVQTNWLHITSPVAGAVGADVTFIADANPTASPRSAAMLIALKTVTVTQAGAECSFGITPSTRSFPVEGGSGVASVQAACSWQVSATADWITFNGLTVGTQNAQVGYTVAPNTCVATRTGNITLLLTNMAIPPSLAVAQVGAPGNLTLSADSVTAGPAASDGRISVNTGDVCAWTATADVSWIVITVGKSGTGNGGISYHLLENTAAQRTGNIRVGAVTFTITQQAPGPPPAVLSSVTNAANYNTDAVSPGEIVALFGDNMGPASIVLPSAADLSGGTYPTLLAGTQVLFDGVAAPMIYTLKGQVSAVVPYRVAGKASTDVQVKFQGVVSNTLTMPVRATTPAIFSLDSSGVGPGAILNQDLTVNSTGNPAARPSVIVLYCTGGGVTTPASADGEVIGLPLRKLPQTVAVTVTVGGVNAVVQYAGAAPGLVAGVTQINAELPAGMAPGIALPVVVKIGDFSSTGSVTVSVK